MSTTQAVGVARAARPWASALRRRAWGAFAVMALAWPTGHVIDEASGTAAKPARVATEAGIRFDCRGDPQALPSLRARMRAYLHDAGIGRNLVRERVREGVAVFTLTTPPGDTTTLDFIRRRDMDLREAIVHLPAGVAGGMRDVATASTKEILLALMQHGRLTDFPCRLEALAEQVGVRQNIVAWAESLEWMWPDGGAAAWNARYWRRGTPVAGHPLHEAVNDAFLHQAHYRIGCYTATKLALLQGVIDYYRRVRPDAARLRRIEARLTADGDPLVDLEPGAMWYFEDGFTAAEAARPGKLVELQRGVAPGNFVPGDWVYLLNTDPQSRKQTGYEGSNAIYLGRGRFDDYYNDNDHAYDFRAKLDEVYQWRNGVFSRSRDAGKATPLADVEYERLARPPEEGGLVEDYRAVVAFGAFADAVEVSPAAR